ncbi:hypothetical protein HPB52_015969 [Rhipicephalus sanguineus]|uniref:Uncharacterized protein n=1 Tax=Rhipicephalus sanguineus TaxID=34632 RepID=A0A9D4PXX1_RHISA|nr:hypothetical protein HPB52_015969 [Rhipicephalus sanguineus]
MVNGADVSGGAVRQRPMLYGFVASHYSRHNRCSMVLSLPFYVAAPSNLVIMHVLWQSGYHEITAGVVRAAEIDELTGARQTETLVRLSTENAVLRQLLDIGRRAGSAGLSDVEVQTDSGSVASPE